MFGYIRTDTPYLYIKDDTLYKAMYCGLCKGIAQSCGQKARMGQKLHALHGLHRKLSYKRYPIQERHPEKRTLYVQQI